jgi:O-antigen ligase
MAAATEKIELGEMDVLVPSEKRVFVTRLMNQALFLSLLTLLFLTSIPYGTVEPWWKALFAIISFALGILWSVEGAVSGRWMVREHRLLIPLAVMGLFAFAQSWPLPLSSSEPQRLTSGGALSFDPFETKFFALGFFALLLCGALFLRYLSSKSRVRALVWVIISVAVASALFGILRQTTHRNGMGYLLPYLKPDSGYGQFINKNHFALLMEMAFGLAVGFVVGGARRDRVLLYLAAALPICAALILSNSRGGLMGMIAQLLFLVLVAPIKREDSVEGFRKILGRGGDSLLLRLALSLCLLLTIALGIAWTGGDETVSRIESISTEVSEADAPDLEKASRKEIWNSSLKLIQDHWLVGVGFGAYGVAIHRYQEGAGKLVPEYAHNDYLELMASGGIIGAALVVWFSVLFVIRVRRVLRSGDKFRRAVCFGALTGIFGVAVHSIVDFGLHIMVNSLIFVALLALATANIPTSEVSERVASGRDGIIQ